VAEFLSFAGPFPVFSISSKPSQVSSNLYRQLRPLFQSFFPIQSCRLGGQNPSCDRIFSSSLDIQTRISWASDIEIKRFESLNLSMRVELQLSWRIQGEIKLFYRTKSSRNLVGKKWSPDLIKKTDECRASWYDWEYNLRITTSKIMMEAEFLVQLWLESCSR